MLFLSYESKALHNEIFHRYWRRDLCICMYLLFTKRYTERQIRQRIERKIQEEKNEKERLINLERENQRKDSVHKYIQAAMRLQKFNPEKA